MKYLKNIWAWIGREQNHNALTVIITSAAVILAFPYFSNQINNVQIKVDSLQASIKSIYGQYQRENFCYSQLKDSFKKINNGNVVDIRLKYEPVPNSVSIWEGPLSVAPSYFTVIGNTVETQTSYDAASLKQACSSESDGIVYVVTYIPSQ